MKHVSTSYAERHNLTPASQILELK